MNSLIQDAHSAAAKARENSYSPYSNYAVGAALLLEGGQIIAGCNVENSSFGATICAERNAFLAAVAQYGKIKPKAIVLITREEAVPCGLCLQVMAEFCGPEFPVYLGTPAGPGEAVPLKELLPRPFSPEALKD
jgi:cytidine deaminase